MPRMKYINFKPVPYHKRHPFFAGLALCLLPALVSGVIAAALRLSPPHLVESVYSAGIFPAISSFLGAISGLTSRSIASGLLMLLAVSAVAVIASFVWLMIKSGDRPRVAGRYLRGLVLAASLALLLFSALCMPNYYRLTFAERAGIALSDYTVSDLRAMCRHLIEEANAQRGAVPDGTVLYYDRLAAGAQSAFSALNEKYPFVGAAASLPKPAFPSEILSVLNLTGFYFPYTGEPNVNVHMPPVELPFTMCHELSHTVGFMRENEANFIGFLACMQSDDAFIRYSGLYCAVVHSMNALYAASPESYFELRELYGEKLEGDCHAVNSYWQPYFDTPASDLSNAVNDVYLKANDLSDGIKSYGRMVDLLMAKYLSEGSLV